MQVHIGPYKDYFGPYQLAEKLCFWAKKETDEYGFPRTPDWVHNFGEWLAHGSVDKTELAVGETTSVFSRDRKTTWLYTFLVWIDSKRSRTVKVHIDNYDTWNMNSTLGLIALPMLKQLKNTTHGAPDVDLEDVPAEMYPSDEEIELFRKDGTTDSKYFERWDYVLDQMIFAFETECGDLQDWEDQFSSGESDKLFKKLDSGHLEMIDGPNNTRKTDWDARAEYAERIRNGFRLFGKYYQNLWD